MVELSWLSKVQVPVVNYFGNDNYRPDIVMTQPT